MSLAYTHERLQLPEGLQRQLHEFRRRVWTIKMVEAACAAVFAIMAAYLLMFLMDRAWDTPVWLRATLLVAAVVGCARVPMAVHRWVWRNRRLDQLAQLLSRKHPQVGDQLLGIIELVRNDFEQSRSPALCEAAVREVAKDAQRRDFSDAVPTPRHRLWAGVMAVPIVLTLGLALAYPGGGPQRLARLLAPWGNTPRYTFAALEPLRSRMVVAHGEPFTVTARSGRGYGLEPGQGRGPARRSDTGNRPASRRPIRVRAPVADRSRLADRPDRRCLAEDTRRADPPPRADLARCRRDAPRLHRAAGQASQGRARRDDLAGRGQPGDLRRHRQPRPDFRSGRRPRPDRPPARPSPARRPRSRDSARWSSAGRTPMASRGKSRSPCRSTAAWTRRRASPARTCHARRLCWTRRCSPSRSGPRTISASSAWVSSGRAWRTRSSRPRPRASVSWPAAATIRSRWKSPVRSRPNRWASSPSRSSSGCSSRIISPAGRGCIRAPYTFYVLTPELHAIWLTEQLSRWHRQAIDVRDKELQLYETNKQLRALAAKELDKPETRRRIENQASAERQNGRRLSGLVVSGEDLVRQAMRNPEFGVGHLEKWAEMLQILKDISGNRMPTVSDLLKQAAQAPTQVAAKEPPPSSRTVMAGQIRATGTGQPKEAAPGAKKDQPVIPRVVDMESSQNSPPDKPLEGKPTPSKGGSRASAPRRDDLDGQAAGLEGAAAEPPPRRSSTTPSNKQRDLLAEFEKVADELNRVLANLEGSTLVKRLEGRLAAPVQGRRPDHRPDRRNLRRAPASDSARTPSKVLDEMAEQEAKGSHDVSLIMDDMQSYFERRQFLRFKTVLDEMRKQDVIGGLRQLGDDIKKENGVSIAQCEFWSDTLDRWAEDLVDPACSGAAPAARRGAACRRRSCWKSSRSSRRGQPPRGDPRRRAGPARDRRPTSTRSRPASSPSRRRASRTAPTRSPRRSASCPTARTSSSARSRCSARSRRSWAKPRRSWPSPRPAARPSAPRPRPSSCSSSSKRINPKSGGGGGRTPAAAAQGTTHDSALALVGGGVNDKEVREDHGIAQRPASPARPCPRSSAPAWMSISTGSKRARGASKRLFQ